MKQQSDFHPAAVQIAVELVPDTVAQIERRFHLHDERFINDHVHCFSAKLLAFIEDDNGDFSCDSVPTRDQFSLERH